MSELEAGDAGLAGEAGEGLIVFSEALASKKGEIMSKIDALDHEEAGKQVRLQEQANRLDSW